MTGPKLSERGIAAMFAVATVLAVSACGSGGPKTVTVVEVTHHPKPATIKIPHTGKPSQCTVWLTTGSALVTFQGNGYNVAPACQAWVANSAKRGTLWTTQTPANLNAYGVDDQVCRLRGLNGWEYATVLDDTTAHATDGQSSCEELLSTGQWTDMPSYASPDYVPPKLPPSEPATFGSPTVKIGHWTGREPSLIDFSADGGNIITNIRWTVWNKTQALGKGQSDIQACVPFCAVGGDMPVTAYYGARQIRR